MTNYLDKLTRRIIDERLFLLGKEEYATLHNKFLNPLDLIINCDLFAKEINQYHDDFKQWGDRYPDLPRYGIPIVNENGRLDNNIDPTIGSLSHWNEDHPDFPVIENDFSVPTEIANIKSLNVLKIFKGELTRSNILKWYAGAEFKPHVDCAVPTPYLRFWGTTDPSTIELSYLDGNVFRAVQGIEKGRLYLIDTSIVHIAKATGFNYQFFISLKAKAWKLIKTHLVTDR